jgi:D-arabinitol 2-dehydrogenase
MWLIQVFDINVFGLFTTAQAVAKHMISTSTPGSIIMISSMSSLIVNRPQPQAAYNASKAAVAHLSRSMVVELAPHGIRVNSLAPGYLLTYSINFRYMNTPLVQSIIAKGGKEYTQYWKDGSPMGKLGEPEDLRGIPL